jgi:hypothetical protein
MRAGIRLLGLSGIRLLPIEFLGHKAAEEMCSDFCRNLVMRQVFQSDQAAHKQ